MPPPRTELASPWQACLGSSHAPSWHRMLCSTPSRHDSPSTPKIHRAPSGHRRAVPSSCYQPPPPRHSSRRHTYRASNAISQHPPTPPPHVQHASPCTPEFNQAHTTRPSLARPWCRTICGTPGISNSPRTPNANWAPAARRVVPSGPASKRDTDKRCSLDTWVMMGRWMGSP